ncbi:MAG: hypothetical protein GX638_00710 [Crenarchaeota archaeon]|nr:hypothetical protein [Thermoproteota archaeon]
MAHNFYYKTLILFAQINTHEFLESGVHIFYNLQSFVKKRHHSVLIDLFYLLIFFKNIPIKIYFQNYPFIKKRMQEAEKFLGYSWKSPSLPAS